ncbi:MAG TPA: TauD/TfdA family dioxygenase, partial [Acidimicrobiales bacterium]|nr:TauD/TfdA family dioxygenase [Acidimicrobiales bacterium]
LDTKGVIYVRNFGEGVDVAWQDFFRTGDRTDVERRCAESGATCEWLADGNLRIRQASRAVRAHPSTGERTFFNQILLHHPAALPTDTRSALRSLYDVDMLPRNVTYGDGSAIPDTVVEHLMAVFDQHAVRFAWQVGDILALDNMLCSHGRATFSGPRKIIVAMGRIVEAADLGG